MNKEQEAKPLTLEDYAGFFHNPNLRRRLSHDQLNQIIFMHGFVRLHRWQKANIVDALNSLDLMHPERSTMREEAPKAPAAAAAVLSLEEVKRDVQFLGWQECPLGSIVTVGAAGNVAEAAVPISSRAGVGCRSVPIAAASGDARLGTNGKKKRKRMLALAEVARRPAPPPPISIMSKRGMNESESESSKKEGREYWNQHMDDVLLDAFLHQYQIGNKVNGTFTTQAYKNILAEVNLKLEKNLTKSNIQNRWKTLKTNFSNCYDLFKTGLSGFTWNPTNKMFTAEPEVWERLIEAHPKAKDWMNKPIENYDKMVILYGKDRATGEHAKTPKEMRQRRSSEVHEELMDNIDGMDNLVDRNEVTLENVDSASTGDMDDENGQEVHSHTPAASTSKGKKHKISKEDSLISSITNATQGMVGALERGTDSLDRAFSRAFPSLPIPEGDVYKLLEDLQIGPKYLMDAFFFLVEHPEKLKAILACPMEMRKTMIMRGAFGPNAPIN